MICMSAFAKASKFGLQVSFQFLWGSLIKTTNIYLVKTTDLIGCFNLFNIGCFSLWTILVETTYF